jgi:hypothetical protein
VAVWKHGVSIYGWPQGRAEGFLVKHPELRTSKGTIQLHIASADQISDDLCELVRVGLGG